MPLQPSSSVPTAETSELSRQMKGSGKGRGCQMLGVSWISWNPSSDIILVHLLGQKDIEWPLPAARDIGKCSFCFEFDGRIVQ